MRSRTTVCGAIQQQPTSHKGARVRMHRVSNPQHRAPAPRLRHLICELIAFDDPSTLHEMPPLSIWPWHSLAEALFFVTVTV